MRRDHANFFHLAIYSAVIILVVRIIPYLLPRIPGRPEFFNEQIISSTNQDEIKELKEEASKEYHLRFDYDDVLGCKTCEPPWDCGIENMIISDVYSQKYAFLPKKKNWEVLQLHHKILSEQARICIEFIRCKRGNATSIYANADDSL